MPQTDFYLVDEDLFSVCGYLLLIGARLVPVMDYPTASYRELVRIDEVKEMRNGQKVLLYFAVHSEWSTQPLPMRSAVKQQDGRKIYYIPQRESPTLDIYCPQLRQEKKSCYVAPGFIAYHGSHYSSRTSSGKAPVGLRAAYRSVCGLLRKDSTALRFASRTLHVTARVKRGEYQLAGLGSSAEAEAL